MKLKSPGRLVRRLLIAQSRCNCLRFYRSFSASRTTNPPVALDEVNAVVLGGGAVGTSIAYHLAKGGLQKVVLLESKTIASGSTAHTPGLISYFHPVPRFWRILSYSIDLYSRIEAETGQKVRFPRPGTIRITRDPKRVEDFRYYISRLDSKHAELLDPGQVADMYPELDTRDVRCALLTKGDGYVDTIGLAVALSSAAKNYGAQVLENCGDLTRIFLRPDGFWNVETDYGTMRVKHVINAAGLWARDTARLVNLDLPVVHVEHQHGLTNHIPSLKDRNLPVLHDVDDHYYVRQEGDQLLFGAFEEQNNVRILEDWTLKGIPRDVLKTTLQQHFETVDKNYTAARKTLKILNENPVQHKYSGVVSMSPDSMPLVGPVVGLKNYWVACGFFDGLSTAGGIGKYLADFIIDNEPPYELVEMDPNRFNFWAERNFRFQKTKESFAFTYAPGYPKIPRLAGRPTCRVSGIYGALIEKNAKMQFTCGWENPTFFGDNETDSVKREYDLIMTKAGLMDFAWLSKMEIRGPDAASFLSFVLSDRPPDVCRMKSTLMLTPKGKILSYVRCIHHDQNQSVYLLVGNPDQENRNVRWLHQIAREKSFNVEINNVTEYLAVIGTGGPKSRDVLSELTKEDLSDEKYPQYATKLLRIAGVPVIGCRIAESGESGWQLYHNRADSLKIYEAIMRAGKKWEFSTIGWDALNVMRLEKGYKRWGVELNLDTHPLEAGIEDMIDMSKGGFVGYEALQRLKQEPLTKKLVQVTIDSELPKNYKFGYEKIVMNKETVGRITSGCFSFAINKYLCFAFVPPKTKAGDVLDVEILGSRFPATMLDKPPVLPYYYRS